MKINFTKLLYQAFRTTIVMSPFLLKVLVLNNNLIFTLETGNLGTMKFCSYKCENSCAVRCNNLILNLRSDVAYLRKIIKKAGQRYKTCKLKLELCVNLKKTRNFWNEIKKNSTIKIDDLKILNCHIDLNDIGLTNLKNLKRLTIKNTTTKSLRRKIFQEVPNLQKLHIQKNIFLQSVEKGFLRNSHLKVLQIQGMNLNQSETKLFFSNLTGDYDVPDIITLDWSQNNFGNFSSDLLENFSNVKNLTLINANISGFEGRALKVKNLQSIYINNNKIQRLPEKLFKPLLQNISTMFLRENNLICDCEMEWLQVFVKKHKNYNFGDFKNLTCVSPKSSSFLETEMCSKKEENDIINYTSVILEPSADCNFTESKATGSDITSGANNLQLVMKLHENARKFIIKNDEPTFIEVSLSDDVELDKVFLWLINFANSTSPVKTCLKNLQRNFFTRVAPDVTYIMCLGFFDELYQISFDCLALKTQPLYENRTWLTKKSIPITVISIIFACLLAMAIGSLILYLSVHRNPTLIRGNKRVIVVKRYDKAQILIMPRGYENLSQTDNASQALMGTCQALEPCRSSLNYDTLSTASYVSVNQPTQLELLTYRLNRLQEIFRQNNNLPPPISSLPMQISTQQGRRLPPNVDLLLEYEWYTITTTTTATAYV